MNGTDSYIGGLSSTTFRQEYMISRTLIFQTGKKNLYSIPWSQRVRKLKRPLTVKI